MKKISRFEKFIAVAFVGGLLCCVASIPVSFISLSVGRVLFFGGGSFALFGLIYSMIKGTYDQ